MILQAHEYEQRQDVVLSGFFTSTEGRFRTDIGKAWAQEVVKRRQSRLDSSGDPKATHENTLEAT